MLKAPMAQRPKWSAVDSRHRDSVPPRVSRNCGMPAAGLVLDLPNQCSASWKPRWPRNFARRFALPGFCNGPSLHERLAVLAFLPREAG